MTAKDCRLQPEDRGQGRECIRRNDKKETKNIVVHIAIYNLWGYNI